jgi:GntR family transcriptional regulator
MPPEGPGAEDVPLARGQVPRGSAVPVKVGTKQTTLLDWPGEGAPVTAEPLYSLVASRAEELIASGAWREGDRLPPERQLCRDFDVSRSTLRQALGELEARGLISRHQGRGTFVTRPRVQLPIAGAFSISEAMRQNGMLITTRVLGVQVIEASRQLASDLACLPGDRLVLIERLRSGNGEPMVLDTAYLREALFPGLTEADLEHRSLYEILRADHGRVVAEAQETIEPVILTPRECQLLGVPQHTTALLTRRITTDASGVVVSLGQVLLRGDRSRYLFRRTVDGPALAPGDVAMPPHRRLAGGAGRPWAPLRPGARRTPMAVPSSRERQDRRRSG